MLTSFSDLIDYLSAVSVTVTTVNCADLPFMKRNRVLLQNLAIFIVDCAPISVLSLLARARFSDLDLLGPHYLWLLVDGHGALEERDLVSGSLLLEGDNVAILKSNRKNMSRTAELNVNPRKESQFSISSYTQGANGVMYMSPVGSWGYPTGLHFFYFLFPMMHQGFNNRQFRVTAVQRFPFTIKYGEGNWSGLCFEIIDELARVLNFSYIVIEPPEQDRHFGIVVNGSNSFNGMIGMLQRKEVDFGVGHFSVIEERQEVVDFTPTFLIDHYIILLRRPNLSQSQIFICFGPFTNEVWLCVAASVILVGAIYHLMCKFHPLSPGDKRGACDWSISTLQVFGAMMQQGMAYVPVFSSGRVLIGLWWFYTIVVVATYNGNLIAFLTAPKVVVPINTIADLVQSDIGFGTTRYAALHGVLKESEHPDMKTLWNRIKDNQDYYLMNNEIEGIRKTHGDSNYAFLLEESYFTSLRTRNSSVSELVCDFVRAEEYFFRSMYAFPFQKDSPYLKRISVGLLRIIEAGLMERWKRKWSTSVTPCNGLERTAEQTNISLAEAQGAFYVLGIGLMCSFFSLMLEYLFSTYILKHCSWSSFKNKLLRKKQPVNLEKKSYAVPAPRSYPRDIHSPSTSDCHSNSHIDSHTDSHTDQVQRPSLSDNISECDSSVDVAAIDQVDLQSPRAQFKTLVVHDCHNVLLRSRSCSIHLNDGDVEQERGDGDSGIAGDVTTIKSHRVLIEVDDESKKEIDKESIPMKITIIGCIDDEDDSSQQSSIVTYL
ncbi:hypothetical protein CAPTEDRAFT_194620 [Capitella teleta]|uniref:Ionotropic glutamate receptor C-terminal domain-containing protein n=1 Tax=Capitella teleta TaxID=283909 RepID=R7VES1_CAPTE|nr:hypothetical protein CAPTEDRAFT_194620 [Capitella teleta]|eukprot:ELU17082.1 hypothetical protein CAPTEDRAFT_194620 [Capitella teleta]